MMLPARMNINSVVMFRTLLIKLMNIRLLSASSDQSSQTRWSEIVQPVKESVLPATVRLAPFFAQSSEVFHD
ncbi:hypothetical protein D5F51_18450 [Yersinia hibernica]|uniref:Secreted protein n=1 Tax=Yersinia hibernica TaxID=2339259 RepID=A0ABX5R4I8_9GAMM|nr:hypothetical protein D5F51_18450 [Yersinia hibernica]